MSGAPSPILWKPSTAPLPASPTHRRTWAASSSVRRASTGSTSPLAHAAEVSTARLHRLLDPAVTGLPSQLARDPGPQAGLVAVHKRAVATTHQFRRLTLPTAISTTDTSNGQEDVQTFSWEAVGNLGEAIRLTRETTACELLAVRQA